MTHNSPCPSHILFSPMQDCHYKGNNSFQWVFIQQVLLGICYVPSSGQGAGTETRITDEFLLSRSLCSGGQRYVTNEQTSIWTTS